MNRPVNMTAKANRPVLWFVTLALWILSSTAPAELLRVRSDPIFALITQSVNAELDFAWGEHRTWALGLYYRDGDDVLFDSARVFSPALRVDFYSAGPRQHGWHPHVMVQTDFSSAQDNDVQGSVRVKARQAYQWVWDPLSLSLGLGVQSGFGDYFSALACYLCPTYEFSVGWQP